jgi:ribonuclease P protein component
LKSRKIIQQLFAGGKSFAIFPLRIIYLELNNEAPCLQAAFSVSTRHFKKAVDRNRIKRLLRESYRLNKHSLMNTLAESNKQVAVFFIFTGKELPEYHLILEKMKLALGKLEGLFLKD